MCAYVSVMCQRIYLTHFILASTGGEHQGFVSGSQRAHPEHVASRERGWSLDLHTRPTPTASPYVVSYCVISLIACHCDAQSLLACIFSPRFAITAPVHNKPCRCYLVQANSISEELHKGVAFELKLFAKPQVSLLS